jgi:hypothetical protein
MRKKGVVVIMILMDRRSDRDDAFPTLEDILYIVSDGV